MRIEQVTRHVRTQGRSLVDVTDEVATVVRSSKVRNGLCSVFIQHTSASLVVQENADPSVLRDLVRWMDKIAPEGSDYEHDAEGPDDMPAHLRTSITRTSETFPVKEGELFLGTWQAIYVFEHRRRPHERTLAITVMGV